MSHSELRAITFLAPNMLPVYQFMVDAISRRLNLPVNLTTGATYEELPHADLTFICGLPYILRADLIEAVAAPVLQGERYQGKPIYFSDVIVHTDSPYHTLQDLRGCSWAYNEPESQSGYGITRYHLAQMNETDGFFGRVIQAGFHQKAIRWVAEGEIDGAAIDSQVLAIELRDHPALAAQLRIIDSLGPSTIQPVAVRRDLPAHLKTSIRDALTTLHAHPDAAAIFARGLIEQFVTVDDSAYDDIRHMLAACRAAGFMELR